VGKEGRRRVSGRGRSTPSHEEEKGVSVLWGKLLARDGSWAKNCRWDKAIGRTGAKEEKKGYALIKGGEEGSGQVYGAFQRKSEKRVTEGGSAGDSPL